MPSSKMQEVAEDYGYQLAFLKSDKELYSVFTKAVNGAWDAARFVSAVRATKWYKTKSETFRQAQQLKYTDPATYNSNISASLADVNRIANEMGATLSSAGRKNIANAVVQFGWNDNQVRENLSRYMKGAQGGQAATVGYALKQTAYRNGVNVSEAYIDAQAKKVALGQITVEDAQNALRTHYGKALAPGFAKELDGGQDLHDLASPYMQTMAKTLELNPSDIDLFDPTIRAAMSSSSDKDGQVGSKPLWEFERDLKKDQRWLKTNGARDQLDKAARSLGEMFGQVV